MLLEEGIYYDQCILLAKLSYPLPCFILYSKAKFASYSRCFLTSYFCIPVPYNEEDKRSYPMSQVRRCGHEETPLIQGKEQQLHFAGAAMKKYPTSKLRETQVRW